MDEKGVECIFFRYAHNSKANKLMVIEPNDSISINTILESHDAIFEEHIFKYISQTKYEIIEQENQNINKGKEVVGNNEEE